MKCGVAETSMSFKISAAGYQLPDNWRHLFLWEKVLKANLQQVSRMLLRGIGVKDAEAGMLMQIAFNAFLKRPADFVL